MQPGADEGLYKEEVWGIEVGHGEYINNHLWLASGYLWCYLIDVCMMETWLREVWLIKSMSFCGKQETTKMHFRPFILKTYIPCRLSWFPAAQCCCASTKSQSKFLRLSLIPEINIYSIKIQTDGLETEMTCSSDTWPAGGSKTPLIKPG